jgi:hypothetical protein
MPHRPSVLLWAATLLVTGGIGTARAAAADVAAAAAADRPGGELRLRWDDLEASTQGPIAAANRLVPGLVAPTRSAAAAQAWARATWRYQRMALTGEVLAAQQRSEDGDASSEGRVNELFATLDQGAWQASAGKKIVSWDVGYGFRPNDVVQQERRRTLLPERIEGRAVIEVERFGAEDAWTLVAVQPQRWNDDADSTRGAGESALAARAYRRFGGADAFAFARWGRHTGWSLGAAGAWVVGDSLELHASARVMNAHDGWRIADGAASVPQPANPWSRATLSGGEQWLVGASWTGEAQQSVLVEAWRDTTTLSDSQWNDWNLRNQALAAGAAPAAARAVNLAWQASPFASPNLRRDNLFVRIAWQPTPWLLALDALVHPADRGRLVTASLQWQGNRWRIDAALRAAEGPVDAVLRQTPASRGASIAATWAW